MLDAYAHAMQVKFCKPNTLHMHSHIHSYNYSFIPYIRSIAYAIDASQRSVLCHEAAVASFNMSNDRPGFKGLPTKGSRLPHVK